MSNDVHTLSGAYALDALSEAEAAEFREHLAVCQACWDEVRELRAAAARMGANEAVTPPESLRQRVLVAADRTPQVPPVDRGDVTTPQRPTTPIVAPSTPAPTPLRPRRRFPVFLAVAAALIVLAGAGVVLWSGDRSADDPGQLPVAAETVFGAPDARTASFATANGGRLRVAVSPERGEMAVDARELPPLTAGEVYQLWAVRDGVMTSAAVLTEPGAAMAMPAEDTAVAVTVEPDGGSAQPTSEPIVQVEPTAL